MINDLKLEGFKQNWEQIRHIERVRLTFTGFYALIAGAGIVFGFGRNEWRIYLFLFILSIAGIILCWRTILAAAYRRDSLESIVKEYFSDIDEKALKALIPFSSRTTLNPFKVRGLYFWMYVAFSGFFLWIMLDTLN